MVVPQHVGNLDEYWLALEEALDRSGGFFEAGYAAVAPVPGTSGSWVALLVEKQRLRFHDGSYLDLTMSVRDDFELIAYNFHYARWDDQLVWRLDRHTGHQHEDGGDTHIHLPNDLRKPHEAVDLWDVLELIQLDQTDDRRPPRAGH